MITDNLKKLHDWFFSLKLIKAIQSLLVSKVGATAGSLFVYYKNLLYSIDLFWNAFALGDPRETFSSTMGKLKASGNCYLCRILCPVISILFLERDHCEKSINVDFGMHTNDDKGVLKGKRSAYANFIVLLGIIAFFCYPYIMDAVTPWSW